MSVIEKCVFEGLRGDLAFNSENGPESVAAPSSEAQSPLTDAEKAAYICQFVDTFRRGCTNAGPMVAGMGLPADPADCPECVEAFLSGVRNVLQSDCAAEPEITPEMIEAGVREFVGFSPEWGDCEEEYVVAIFKAMFAKLP